VIAAFRALVVIVALAALATTAVALSGVAQIARVGLEYNTLPGGQFRVIVVDAGSPAERAGIRPRDLVSFVSPADREIVFNHVAGAHARLRRSDGTIYVVTPALVQNDPRRVVELIQGVFFALLALLIAARAWHDVQARRLSAGFLWTTFFFAPAVVAGNVWLLRGCFYATDVLAPLGMASLVYFATGWRATPIALARNLRIAAVASGAAYAMVNIASEFVDQATQAALSRGVQLVESVAWTLLAALVIAGLIGSFRVARGAERQRIGWILATLTAAFLPWMIFEPLAGLGVTTLPEWLAYTTIIVPFGLAYATLRHRCIDLGFALNRAAVFAATTALLVGLFGALQWGADQLLTQATGRENFAAQMAIAVVVLYVVRALRTQTDSFVARVFFAARRKRIDAIYALAREVDAVESPEALAPFVVQALGSIAATEVSVYVESEDVYVRAAGTLGPASVARDAPTVIGLRATLEPVPVRAGSDLAGAVAFPLTVRARLRGALVCGLPAGDDEFAPDESEALMRLATRMAIARDDLLAQALRERVEFLERENDLLERLSRNGNRAHDGATAAVPVE
jgi:GAF domain-containing protein